MQPHSLLALGRQAHQAGDLATAIRHYEAALAAAPDSVELLQLLASALLQHGNTTEAIGHFRRALDLRPQDPNIRYNYGVALQTNNQLTEAVKAYQEALQVEMLPHALENLGLALAKLGRHQEALKTLLTVLPHKSSSAQLHSNLGEVYRALGDYGAAEHHLRSAVQIEPRFGTAWSNLAAALNKQGRIEESIYCLRRSLSINPHQPEKFSALLLSLHYLPEFSPDAVYNEHLRWNQQFRHQRALQTGPPAHQAQRKPLRIGYVSPDFRNHAVAHFITPLLRHHRRDEVTVFGYHLSEKSDQRTAELQALCDHWRPASRLTDSQLEQQIRADEIDILVDLAGHTGNNRLTVFTMQPAPVQVSYLGYPNTTGVPEIGYRITDGWADPPGQDGQLYTETLLRLPCGFLCYDPPPDAPGVDSLPALNNGYITFGSFNNIAKVTIPMIGIWAQILTSLPTARLIMKAVALSDGHVRQRVLRLFSELGVDAERLELIGFEPDKSAHLAIYNRVDVALDTFPYHGTTTTCDSLWMGVPVISRLGNHHVSRVAASLLRHGSLDRWLVRSEREYVEKAVSCASSLAELDNVRQKLREQLRRSPLLDGRSFAATIEAAYRTIWEAACATPEP